MKRRNPLHDVIDETLHTLKWIELERSREALLKEYTSNEQPPNLKADPS